MDNLAETKQQHQDRLTVNVKQAATLLGVGVNHAYNLVRSGRLKSIRIGRRVIIPKREIDAFLEREAEGDLNE